MKKSVLAPSARLLGVVSCAAIIAACAKTEEAPAAPAADSAVAEPEVAPEPMVEAVEETEDQSASATVTVTLTNGAPAFGAVSEGACSNGTCVGGVDLNAAGNVDLTSMPPGDVTITVNLDSSVTGAGYSFPSDPYQAVAIVIIPAGTVTAPIPVFGQANWPAEFDAPSVSTATLTFVDKDDDQNAYEYSIQLMRSDGSRLVMDPKIQGGGSGTGNR